MQNGIVIMILSDIGKGVLNAHGLHFVHGQTGNPSRRTIEHGRDTGLLQSGDIGSVVLVANEDAAFQSGGGGIGKAPDKGLGDVLAEEG